MREFLARGFAFGMLFAAVSFGASRCFDGTVAADSLTGRTDRQFESTESGFTTMVYGDSHPKRGVIPDESTFNYASQGESYVETYYRVRRSLEKPAVASEMTLAVLPFDLHSFSSFRFHRYVHPGYVSRYVDFIEVGRRSGRVLRYVGISARAMFLSYLGQGDDLWEWIRIRFLGDGRFRPLDRGWLGSRGDFSRSSHRTERAAERASHHFRNACPLDPTTQSYFEDTLRLLGERGRKVLLVRYPVTAEYIEAALPYFRRAGLEPPSGEEYADGESVFLLDARRQYVDRPGLFADPDHVNATGASIFTELLRREIARITGR